MKSLEQMEARIIEMLQPLKATADKLGARYVEPYQDELTPEKISRLQTYFPALFVIYGGSHFNERGGHLEEEQTWVVFACDKSHRGTEAASGGSLNVGTYGLLSGVRSSLAGVKPFSDVPPFKLLGQRAIHFDKGLSVYAAEYGVTMSGKLLRR